MAVLVSEKAFHVSASNEEGSNVDLPLLSGLSGTGICLSRACAHSKHTIGGDSRVEVWRICHLCRLILLIVIRNACR